MRGISVMLRGLVLVLLLVILPWRASGAAVPTVSTSYLVKMTAGATPAPSLNARPLYGLADTYRVELDGMATKTALERQPEVVYLEPNPRITLDDPSSTAVEGVIAATVNDPMAGEQYSLARMGVGEAWEASRGDGIVIAVIDTGLDFTHPDLAGKAVSRGRDLINGDNDATDDHGHGTHVASIAAAVTNNGLGMAGVGYNARILPVKALGRDGSGEHSSLAEAIVWAADQGVQIINMSFGAPYTSQTLQAAIDYASRSALLVCAAGNSATSQPFYPAAYSQCLAVAASDGNDRLARFSNYGPGWVDVAAPGVAVLGALRNGGYQAWDGTSMAAPNVAGVAALVQAAHRTWDRPQVRAALEQSTDPVLRDTTRAGRVNAARAVGANAPLPLPNPQPAPTPSGDYAQDLTRLINQTRRSAGLTDLRLDARLVVAADFHNRWMRDRACFNHNCPGEPDVLQRMRNAGYPVVSGGENIGKGYRDPAHMLEGWMDSAGHKAAILNAVWPDIGCAYLRGPSGAETDTYWSCEFARSAEGPFPPPLPPTATPRPPTPPQTHYFNVRIDWTAGWDIWDWIYYNVCEHPAPGVRCTWPEINPRPTGGDERIAP